MNRKSTQFFRSKLLVGSLDLLLKDCIYTVCPKICTYAIPKGVIPHTQIIGTNFCSTSLVNTAYFPAKKNW